MLICVLAVSPAHADMLGTLVNNVMGTLLNDGLNTPEEPVVADSRPIPEAADSGVMSRPQGRQVHIDGRKMRLSPGCQIRDLHNRIVLPGSVPETAPVRYLLDAHTQVHRVWLMASR